MLGLKNDNRSHLCQLSQLPREDVQNENHFACSLVNCNIKQVDNGSITVTFVVTRMMATLKSCMIRSKESSGFRSGEIGDQLLVPL